MNKIVLLVLIVLLIVYSLIALTESGSHKSKEGFNPISGRTPDPSYDAIDATNPSVDLDHPINDRSPLVSTLSTQGSASHRPVSLINRDPTPIVPQGNPNALPKSFEMAKPVQMTKPTETVESLRMTKPTEPKPDVATATAEATAAAAAAAAMAVAMSDIDKANKEMPPEPRGPEEPKEPEIGGSSNRIPIAKPRVELGRPQNRLTNYYDQYSNHTDKTRSTRSFSNFPSDVDPYYKTELYVQDSNRNSSIDSMPVDSVTVDSATVDSEDSLANFMKEALMTDESNGSEESGECDITTKCSADTCGSESLHPILDPKFNMREVAKQALLLEDHLNNLKKRCYDCIRKHFLIVDGLLEEAVSLEQNVDFRSVYRQRYMNWLALEKQYSNNPLDSNNLDNLSKSIRMFRKPLVAEYFDLIREYDLS